jgi:hypothetical protein
MMNCEPQSRKAARQLLDPSSWGHSGEVTAEREEERQDDRGARSEKRRER